MKLRNFLIRLLLNLYPPILFNRIVIKMISEDFTSMKVILKKSIFNINFHKTIFGGVFFQHVILFSLQCITIFLKKVTII